MFVGGSDGYLAFSRGEGDRRDIGGMPGCVVAQLAAECETVLICPRYSHLRRHILGCLGHRVDAIGAGDPLMDKTPADGAVMDFGAARKGAVGLRHNEGRPAHALDAACNHQFRRPAGNRPGTEDHGVKSTGTEPVDRQGRHRRGQAGQQHRHAGDVAVVFARLIGATKNHLVDRQVIARQHGVDHMGCHVIRPHRRECSAIPPDGRALAPANENLGHVIVSSAGIWRSAPSNAPVPRLPAPPG